MEILRERLSKCKAIQEILQEQMTVAGIISEAFKQYKLTPVVVGGLAVEFYKRLAVGSIPTRRAREIKASEQSGAFCYVNMGDSYSFA